jgi:hypothetical protein
MSVTFTWEVVRLDAAPSENGLHNVVKIVHWKYHANDGVNSTYMVGTMGLSPPNPAAFVDYNSLTEAEVISWLETIVDKEDIQRSLTLQLEAITNPPIVPQPLPWG